MKKKLLSMLLIAAMAVTLVACGTDEKPSKDDNDNKKPTNTVVDATETPSTDVVETTPAEVETETPEPEKNVITLLSPDGSKVIHEFPIPNGYTVTSDKKSNHVVLEKDDDATIKVELVSGPCAEVLSAEYLYVDINWDNSQLYQYKYAGTMAWANMSDSESTENTINTTIDKICAKSGIDKTYFTANVDNIVVPTANEYANYVYTVKYPEQYNKEPRHDESAHVCDFNCFWDLSKHTDYSDYKITSYAYNFEKDGVGYLPADETFSIQITTTFDANKYEHSSDTIEGKIKYYVDDVSCYDIEDVLEDNFNMNNHTCEHCK